MSNTPDVDRFLNLSQVRQIIPVSKATIWAWCRGGRFPKPIKLAAKTTVWRESEVRAYMDEMEAKSRGKKAS